MSDWKTAHRSFYYATAGEPEDPVLDPAETALLVIDIQNTYMEPPDEPDGAKRWAPFFERMNGTVIPNTMDLIESCRDRNIEVIFARIACLTEDGRDRSLSQKKPGFNYLLLPKDREDSQLVPQLVPRGDEIVVLKTTDSALTGHQPTPDSPQRRHQERNRGGHLHGPVREQHSAQPGGRELQRAGGRRLLRGGHHGPAQSRARDHQHDLLSRGAVRRHPDIHLPIARLPAARRSRRWPSHPGSRGT